MGRRCDTCGRKQDACQGWVVKPEEKNHFKDMAYMEGQWILKHVNMPLLDRQIHSTISF